MIFLPEYTYTQRIFEQHKPLYILERNNSKEKHCRQVSSTSEFNISFFHQSASLQNINNEVSSSCIPHPPPFFVYIPRTFLSWCTFYDYYGLIYNYGSIAPLKHPKNLFHLHSTLKHYGFQVLFINMQKPIFAENLMKILFSCLFFSFRKWALGVNLAKTGLGDQDIDLDSCSWFHNIDQMRPESGMISQ